MALKTDYQDDVLDGLRKYRTVNNSDGTVSFVDVTEYVTEGDDYGANDINATNSLANTTSGNLATIEETSTASQAYAVGDYMVYNGILYKVTQAITSGGTITVGTNITADKVGDELKGITASLTELESSLVEDHSGLGNYITLSDNDYMVSVYIMPPNTAASAWSLLGTLPAVDFPVRGLSVRGYNDEQYRIDANGKVYYASPTQATRLGTVITYVKQHA